MSRIDFDNITRLTESYDDSLFFEQVFDDMEKDKGMMILGNRLFCTSETSIPKEEEMICSSVDKKLSLEYNKVDVSSNCGVVKFLEMDDGTIITWTKDTNCLPEQAKKHWNNHDILFTIQNETLGYTAYISIPCLGKVDHPTKGSRFFAPGGIRWVDYNSKVEALTDAMDMSLAVAMKIEAVGATTAGNKVAVIGDKNRKKEILASLFAAIQRQGLVITAADLGLSTEDLQEAALEVAPSSMVPLGVFKDGIPSSIPTADATVACLVELVQEVLEKEVNKAIIGIQGIGEVGWRILEALNKMGARVIVSEIDLQTIEKIKNKFANEIKSGNIIVLEESDSIFDCEMDIFSPCACRGILNSRNLERMTGKVKIIAGPANNLWEDLEEDVWNYHNAGIKVVPYEGIGAGGVVGVAYSITRGIMGKEVINIDDKIKVIKDYVKMIINLSMKFNLPPQIISDKILLSRNKKNRSMTKEETDLIIEKLRSAFQQNDLIKEREIVRSITKNGFFED